MSSPKRVFLSYAPEDESLRINLEKHLSSLERAGRAVIWHAGKLLPGDDGAQAADKQLQMADLVLLLVTPDFLASDPLHDDQLRPALARRDAGGARVVPILAKPCAWKTTGLARLEPLPKNRIPITLWQHPDEAWARVADDISELLSQSPSRQQTTNASTEQVCTEVLDTPREASASSTSRQNSTNLALAARPGTFDGVWIDIETSGTYCIREVEGQIRGCYSYIGQDRVTGEFYDCALTADALVARFRWIDDKVKGCVYVCLKSPHEAHGGWWYDYDVPDRMKLNLPRLSDSLPGMMPYRWIRRTSVTMPYWAEIFFSERKWTE